MKSTICGLILIAGLQPQQPAPSTPNRVDALVDVAIVSTSADRSLSLEPGVRATKTENGYTLSTYDGSKIRLKTGTETRSLTSPIQARATSSGWNFGFGDVQSTSVSLSRDVQDDTDSNLKSMQENAKKLKSKNPPTNNNNPNQPNNNNQGNPVKHWRLLFSENPMATAELFNGPAIQQLSHMSPIGF